MAFRIRSYWFGIITAIVYSGTILLALIQGYYGKDITGAFITLIAGLIIGQFSSYIHQTLYLTERYDKIEATLYKIEEDLKKPIITRTIRHEMYSKALKLVKGTTQRLLVVQRTPSLFFDSKPPGKTVENKFKEKLSEVLEKAKRSSQLKVIYAFSVFDPHFEEELVEIAKRKGKDSANKIIDEIIHSLEETENEGGYEGTSYIISLEPDTVPHPLIISDDSIALWITDIESNKLYIELFDKNGSEEIFNHYLRLAEDFKAEPHIRKLKELKDKINKIEEVNNPPS